MNQLKDKILQNFFAKNGNVKPNINLKYQTEINQIIQLTNFLGANVVLAQRMYHIINNLFYIPECIGGNILTFNSIKQGYFKHCKDKKCKCWDDITLKRINTNKEKYGKEYPFQSNNIQDKIKTTVKERI